jgi:hypothetical protein
VLLEKKSASEGKNDARAPLMFIMSYPHPRQPTFRFLNPKASERSSMKNPECLGRFAELARVLVRLDHVARYILNANHRVMGAAAVLGVIDGPRSRPHTTAGRMAARR